MVTLTYVIYLLHGASLAIGLYTTENLLGAFVFGWPSIIAVILNYLKRSEVAGTFLESHFRWQIRTFWFALLWLLLGLLLSMVVIGFLLLAIMGLWAVYRIVRGLLALSGNKPLPV
jgi:uncharacterized membrane protein